MKAMQDKEFDQVFTDAFADMDVQPSEQVWNAVSRQVQKSKTKYRWLAMAASLLLVASAGLWFMIEKDKTPEQIVAKKEPVKRVLEKPVIEMDQVPVSAQKEEVLAEVKTVRKEKDVHFTAKNRVSNPVSKPEVSEELEFKQTFKKPDDETLLTVVHEADLPELNQMPSVGLASALNTKPEKLNREDITLRNRKVLAKKHPVKSIGDLVNLVMAKVDKREDKLIEFTDSDGESNVSGINLGFINIQKAK